jgi:hypothetical protein
MLNDRPIDDVNLQAGLLEIKEIMHRRQLAGAAMLVSPLEAAFTYGVHAPWSALRPDPKVVPLGFRFVANSQRDGKLVTERRVEGALHTICQLSDFGAQTHKWMEDLKDMLRVAGIEFEHVSFGGQQLPDIGTR